MSSLFRRPEVVPSTVPHLIGYPPPEIQGEVFSNPYELVEASQATLHASAQAWQYVAQRAAGLQAPHITSALEGGVKAIGSSYGVAMHPTTVENQARRFASDFSIYGLLVARYMSEQSDPYAVLADRAHYRRLLGIRDGMVGRMVDHPDFPMQELVNQPIKDMTMAMYFGNRASHMVLHALVDGYAQDEPERLFELAEVFESGIADVDSGFSELREIVNADWYQPDGSKSVLRRFRDRVFRERAPYVAEFSRTVAEADHSKRLSAVRHMALFAVAAARSQGVTLSVADALSATADQWEHFADISGAFENFIGEKRTQTEGAIATIAGPSNPKSIRMPRTLKEVEGFKEALSVQIGNRWHRRGMRGGTKTDGKRTAINKLPDAETISGVATQEIEREPLRIMTARHDHNGIAHLSELALDDVIETFSVGEGNGHLQADVRTMVEHLQTEPISRATTVLKAKTITVVEEESGRTVKVPLRRFAPESSPGLGIKGDNRYHRIVFALVNKALVLVRIGTHEEYNNWY